jgi:DNA-directed RNA polymerase subunit alpha
MLLDTVSAKIERLDDGSDPTYGKFVVEPLEKGYGTTLGSALRRVLLSSIPGAAIVAARIESVLHEFSTIPGVVEDTTELLLNLKELAIRVSDSHLARGEAPFILRVDRTGPGELLAADVETPAEVEIVNKELHLATLDSENAHLGIEMEVEVGTGYVVAEQQRRKHDIGTIPVDAIFSPVRRVAFRVEPTRVGHLTDYDRLTLEVRTNGTISPGDAISEAAKILDRYLILFFDFSADEREEGISAEADLARQRLLETRIEDLDFSVRTGNCLRKDGVTTVGQLVERTESDLMQIRNFGRKSLNEVKAKLKELGVTLAGAEGAEYTDEDIVSEGGEDEEDLEEPEEEDEE